MKNGTLTIRGKRKEDKEARDDDYCACERWTGTFFRSVALPPGIDAERVRATFRSGVLEVHFPETKEAKAKEIEIGVE